MLMLGDINYIYIYINRYYIRDISKEIVANIFPLGLFFCTAEVGRALQNKFKDKNV